ncbi:MAG: hypothetical protein ACLGXA_22910 [Acidobacteriota bacterium]
MKPSGLHSTLRLTVRFLVLLSALAPLTVYAQTAQEIVSTVVRNELNADANDHSRWMYRDAYKSPDKDIVKLVIETPQGNLSMVIEDHGRPPSAQTHQDDLNRIQQMVSDPALRARMKKAEQHDGQQARDMLNLLPKAFVWKIVDRSNGETKLSFHPDPNFSPDSMSGKVLAAMSGTMVVHEAHMRLKNLSGHLDHDVTYAWGLLGRINAGGTFQILREDVGEGSWQITGMHVHISGHALFFKTIGDQEDEVTTEYHPVPDDVDIAKAAQMLKDGEVARILGGGNKE